VDLPTASPSSASVAPRPTRFIARQPIFDRQEHVYGYELLFRSGLENRYTGDDRDAAACDVADYFLSAGAKPLTAGRKAFINCTRQFLVKEYATLLPKEEAVVEILETIEPDAEVLAACRRLKDMGYVIALDDFAYAEKFEPFVELADIIKIDFKFSGPSERKQAIAKFLPRGIRLLAEKVETRAEFAEARDSGYVYFQGYFFCKPQIVPSLHIPAFKVHYLRILQAINKPELDRHEIVTLIEREISLWYKLLRFVNSPLFGFLREISSTRHALALLGDRELRKWACVAAVLGIAGNKPNELVLTSLTRGRCCELLAANRDAAIDEQSMFLLGVFSLMEAMLGRPMSEIVSEIALPDVVRAALLGRPNHYREILDLVKAFEAGSWNEVSELVADLRQDESHLSAAYLEAVDWAQKVFQI
jgi:EAL and modified HD-GYP domain-containing signal transduction protein